MIIRTLAHPNNQDCPEDIIEYTCKDCLNTVCAKNCPFHDWKCDSAWNASNPRENITATNLDDYKRID